MHSERLLPNSQDPPPVPILSHINPVHAIHPTFWRFILILSFNIQLDLSGGLCPSELLTKVMYAPLLSS